MNDADVAEIAARLHSLPASDSAGASFDRIRALEDLKSMIAAVQLAETNTFRAMRRAENLAKGEPTERPSTASRARSRRPGGSRRYRAQRYVGWRRSCTTELPHTYAALARGEMSEWRAMIVARETIWLSREQRARWTQRSPPASKVWVTASSRRR